MPHLPSGQPHLRWCRTRRPAPARRIRGSNQERVEARRRSPALSADICSRNVPSRTLKVRSCQCLRARNSLSNHVSFVGSYPAFIARCKRGGYAGGPKRAAFWRALGFPNLALARAAKARYRLRRLKQEELALARSVNPFALPEDPRCGPQQLRRESGPMNTRRTSLRPRATKRPIATELQLISRH
jgi:hypothetical protein